MAWASVEARRRLVHEIAENFRAYLDDEKRNVVN
jgi:lactate dehydrogenase-like 2-hydroxyacid dehydrogenase